MKASGSPGNTCVSKRIFEKSVGGAVTEITGDQSAPSAGLYFSNQFVLGRVFAGEGSQVSDPPH